MHVYAATQREKKDFHLQLLDPSQLFWRATPHALVALNIFSTLHVYVIVTLELLGEVSTGQCCPANICSYSAVLNVLSVPVKLLQRNTNSLTTIQYKLYQGEWRLSLFFALVLVLQRVAFMCTAMTQRR